MENGQGLGHSLQSFFRNLVGTTPNNEDANDENEVVNAVIDNDNENNETTMTEDDVGGGNESETDSIPGLQSVSNSSDSEYNDDDENDNNEGETTAPTMTTGRRPRGTDAGDEERDRRHPAHRTNSSLSAAGWSTAPSRTNPANNPGLFTRLGSSSQGGPSTVPAPPPAPAGFNPATAPGLFARLGQVAGFRPAANPANHPGLFTRLGSGTPHTHAHNHTHTHNHPHAHPHANAHPLNLPPHPPTNPPPAPPGPGAFMEGMAISLSFGADGVPRITTQRLPARESGQDPAGAAGPLPFPMTGDDTAEPVAGTGGNPIPNLDIGALFAALLGGEPGMFGGGREVDDIERARMLIEGLEVVNPGLVERLERAARVCGGNGSNDGMGAGDGGCAICWERLLGEEEGAKEEGAEEEDGKAAESIAEGGALPPSTATSDAAPPPDSASFTALPAETSSTAPPAETSSNAPPPENKIVSLPCAHIFHSECLVPWFSKRRQTSCPTCRFQLDPERLTEGYGERERERRRREREAGGQAGGAGTAPTAAMNVDEDVDEASITETLAAQTTALAAARARLEEARTRLAVHRAEFGVDLDREGDGEGVIPAQGVDAGANPGVTTAPGLATVPGVAAPAPGVAPGPGAAAPGPGVAATPVPGVATRRAATQAIHEHAHPTAPAAAATTSGSTATPAAAPAAAAPGAGLHAALGPHIHIGPDIVLMDVDVGEDGLAFGPGQELQGGLNLDIPGGIAFGPGGSTAFSGEGGVPVGGEGVGSEGAVRVGAEGGMAAGAEGDVDGGAPVTLPPFQQLFGNIGPFTFGAPTLADVAAPGPAQVIIAAARAAAAQRLATTAAGTAAAAPASSSTAAPAAPQPNLRGGPMPLPVLMGGPGFESAIPGNLGLGGQSFAFGPPPALNAAGGRDGPLDALPFPFPMLMGAGGQTATRPRLDTPARPASAPPTQAGSNQPTPGNAQPAQPGAGAIPPNFLQAIMEAAAAAIRGAGANQAAGAGAGAPTPPPANSQAGGPLNLGNLPLPDIPADMMGTTNLNIGGFVLTGVVTLAGADGVRREIQLGSRSFRYPTPGGPLAQTPVPPAAGPQQQPAGDAALPPHMRNPQRGMPPFAPLLRDASIAQAADHGTPPPDTPPPGAPGGPGPIMTDGAGNMPFLGMFAGAGAGTFGFPIPGPRAGAAPGRREKRAWALPSAPGLTIRQRVEKMEREAGLRCSDVSCGVGPSDEEPDSCLGEDGKVQIVRQIAILKNGKEEDGEKKKKVCEHTFHPPCLVTAERVQWKGDEEGHVDGASKVDVSCPVCRVKGAVSMEDWKDGAVVV